jgi:hypothetical protein
MRRKPACTVAPLVLGNSLGHPVLIAQDVVNRAPAERQEAPSEQINDPLDDLE